MVFNKNLVSNSDERRYRLSHDRLHFVCHSLHFSAYSLSNNLNYICEKTGQVVFSIKRAMQVSPKLEKIRQTKKPLLTFGKVTTAF